MIKKETGSFLSLQFFSFANRAKKLRALADMGRRTVRKAHDPPIFCRHLGSGAGDGFSLMPDFSTYAFLSVWDSKDAALSHLKNENFRASWTEYADEQLGILMQCTKVHGAWGGKQVLQEEASSSDAEPVAVLTRAKIKFNKLARFWQYVPQSSRAIKEAEGCSFSKGVGEWPLSTLATFSIWENNESMKTFAYHDPQHAEIIQKVREEGWFAEEMFARFNIVSVTGSYHGFSEKDINYANTQL